MENIVWKEVKKYEDITYKKSNGVARIAFNRPEVRNAFRPKTTSELYDAFYDAHEDPSIGVVLLSGEGPSPKDGVFSFCSGGDQRARGHKGYVGEDGYHRLNILEVQRLIRFMPKAVIAEEVKPKSFRSTLFELGSRYDTPVYERSELVAEQIIKGPAIVEQMDTTILIFPNDVGLVDGWGNLIISLSE